MGTIKMTILSSEQPEPLGTCVHCGVELYRDCEGKIRGSLPCVEGGHEAKGGRVANKYSEQEIKSLLKESTEGKITAKDGLLWDSEGKYISLPKADMVAWAHGFYCAEQMVRKLTQKGEKNDE